MMLNDDLLKDKHNPFLILFYQLLHHYISDIK